MKKGYLQRAFKNTFQPSLVRRVVLALLISIAAVWCAVIGMDYVVFKTERPRLTLLGWVEHTLADSLVGTNEGEACAVARAIELVFNQPRQSSGLKGIEDVMYRLDGPSGNTLCASEAMDGTLITEGSESTHYLRINDRQYWAIVLQAPPWTLTLAEPVVSGRQYVYWLAAELLRYFLVAIPILLLPLWFVVYRGLLPLRALARRIATRNPSDVSPLGLNSKHVELKTLEDSFDQLLARVRQSLERERTFVLDAAHELRTPLAVITAQAHAVAATSGEQQIEARTALNRATQRASHLIHQLLSLSSIESVAQPHLKRSNLVELAQQIVVARSEQADERDLNLSLDSPNRLIGSVCAESFHRVLDNLLGNALSYCSPGGRVEVKLSKQGNRALLCVQDDGPGIDPADQPHLFERFHRGKSVQRAGTGLGLSIVRGAASAMGGTVKIGPGLDNRGIGFIVEFDFPSDAPN